MTQSFDPIASRSKYSAEVFCRILLFFNWLSQLTNSEQTPKPTMIFFPPFLFHF